jgi:hypothetical protein
VSIAVFIFVYFGLISTGGLNSLMLWAEGEWKDNQQHGDGEMRCVGKLCNLPNLNVAFDCVLKQRQHFRYADGG